MEIHVIKTEEDYNRALSAINSLLEVQDDAEATETLELLSILVESYPANILIKECIKKNTA